MATSPGSDRAGLDGIPPELLKNIVGNLDRHSTCKLRLTSRYLRTFTYHRFSGFFIQRKTDLTRESLIRLGQIAAHPEFGSAVRSLMVMAVVCDGSKFEQILSPKKQRRGNRQSIAGKEKLMQAWELRDQLISFARRQQQMSSSHTDRELLAIALCRFRSLPTLQIEGAVYDGTTGYRAASKMRKWHLVFLRASQVLRTVMLAIASSGVAIEKLHIYKTSHRCSVPSWENHEVMLMLNGTAFDDAGRYIKTLSLSFSTDFEYDGRKPETLETLSDIERVYYDDSCVADAGDFFDDGSPPAQSSYAGVARLLQCLPNLETLDLHFYNTYSRRDDRYVTIFTYIAVRVHLPTLRHITFRGLICKGADLVDFLKAHQASIQVLSLRQIYLVDRGWATVFEQLCTMPSLQTVRLDTLWTSNDPLFMHLGRKSQSSLWSNSQDETGWEGEDDSSQWFGTEMFARNFTREEFLREQFQFAERPQRRVIKCGAAISWHQSREREFGPP